MSVQNLPPQTQQDAVRATYSNKKLWFALQGEYGEISLRRLAGAISEKHHLEPPLTHGTLHRALNGTKPKRREWRAALISRKPHQPRQYVNYSELVDAMLLEVRGRRAGRRGGGGVKR